MKHSLIALSVGALSLVALAPAAHAKINLEAGSTKLKEDESSDTGLYLSAKYTFDNGVFIKLTSHQYEQEEVERFLRVEGAEIYNPNTGIYSCESIDIYEQSTYTSNVNWHQLNLGYEWPLTESVTARASAGLVFGDVDFKYEFKEDVVFYDANGTVNAEESQSWTESFNQEYSDSSVASESLKGQSLKLEAVKSFSSKFDVFVGVSYDKVKVEDVNLVDGDITWSIGAEYVFYKDFGAKVEFDKYKDFDRTSVALTYRF